MKKVIQRQIFKYGYLPMLIVLDRMEDKQEFELCHLISETLSEHSDKYNLDLPKKMGNDAILDIKITFLLQFGLDGNTAILNSEYYADEIEKAITANA